MEETNIEESSQYETKNVKEKDLMNINSSGKDGELKTKKIDEILKKKGISDIGRIIAKNELEEIIVDDSVNDYSSNLEQYLEFFEKLEEELNKIAEAEKKRIPLIYYIDNMTGFEKILYGIKKFLRMDTTNLLAKYERKVTIEYYADQKERLENKLRILEEKNEELEKKKEELLTKVFEIKNNIEIKKKYISQIGLLEEKYKMKLKEYENRLLEEEDINKRKDLSKSILKLGKDISKIVTEKNKAKIRIKGYSGILKKIDRDLEIIGKILEGGNRLSISMESARSNLETLLSTQEFIYEQNTGMKSLAEYVLVLEKDLDSVLDSINKINIPETPETTEEDYNVDMIDPEKKAEEILRRYL